MNPGDREQIEQLLQDRHPYRAIARETGYSDWLIRKIAREVNGDPRPMRSAPSPNAEDGSGLTGWLVIGGIATFIGLLIWARIRWMPQQSWD